MKVVVKDWHAVAHWRWATGKDKDKEVTATGGAEDEEDEEDICGICRVPFEGCCPNCKVPGDDCPLSEFMWCWGFLVFGLKYLRLTPSSRQVYAYLPYALSSQVDRVRRCQRALSYGSKTLG